MSSFSFMGLPPELRLLTYEHLLRDNTINPWLSLLKVNRTIHNEVLTLLKDATLNLRLPRPAGEPAPDDQSLYLYRNKFGAIKVRIFVDPDVKPCFCDWLGNTVSNLAKLNSAIDLSNFEHTNMGDRRRAHPLGSGITVSFTYPNGVPRGSFSSFDRILACRDSMQRRRKSPVHILSAIMLDFGADFLCPNRPAYRIQDYLLRR